MVQAMGSSTRQRLACYCRWRSVAAHRRADVAVRPMGWMCRKTMAQPRGIAASRPVIGSSARSRLI